MRVLSIALLGLLVSCDRGGAPPAATGGPSAPPEAEPAAPTPGPGHPVTGALSEDDFAALHRHRGDDAPAPRGETVALEDGSSAYLSLPDGTGPHPGVLVIHEWWGLNDHIRHWADRLAADGYAALAVDLYGGQVATEPPEAMALVRGVDEAAATRTLRAAHALLKGDPRIRAPRTASIGWCFGGGWSLRAGLALEGQAATVVYYGQTIDDAARLRTLAGPVLGVFGTQDPSIPEAQVDAFERALAEAEVAHEIHRYDAEHAFANPSSGRYDRASAERAWAEVRRFLRAALTDPDG